MFATCRTHIILRLGDSFHIGKIFIDLIVKFGAVSDNYESPVTLKFAQDFLRKEHHRKGFAAALCMPEDAESAPDLTPGPSPVRRGEIANRIERIVDTQELVVFSNDLLQTTLALLEEGEVLNQIQQTGRFAHTPQHGLQ